MRLTAAHVQQITGDADRWLDPLNAALGRWEINTPPRVLMFLAQCAHESGGFRHLVENLHYSAAALLSTWPNRFTAEEAVAFAYDERRIAERAYGGRMGNGPEGSGDGYLYRGRGIIQLTGRDNYRRCGAALGVNLEASPLLLESPSYAAQSAGWFWSANGCNELADAGDFEGATRRINGGLNGYEDRKRWLAKVRAILGTDAAETEAHKPPVTAPGARGATDQLTEVSMLQTLLPMILGMFAPRAQAAIGRVTGADPATAAQFTQDLFAKAGELVGVPVKDDASAIQAVAKLQERKAAGDLQPVQRLEAHALDYLDKLAPLFDRLAETDRWARESQLAGQRAAMERQAAADPATVRVVVENVNATSTAILGGLGAGVIVAMVCKAIWPTLPDYVTPLLTLAGPLFGQVMKERGAIIAYYFDGTPTSNAAATINAQIAKVGNPPAEARSAIDRSA